MADGIDRFSDWGSWNSHVDRRKTATCGIGPSQCVSGTPYVNVDHVPSTSEQTTISSMIDYSHQHKQNCSHDLLYVVGGENSNNTDSKSLQVTHAD